jgi:hypothetical protein
LRSVAEGELEHEQATLGAQFFSFSLQEALKLALADLLKQGDVKLYKTVVERLGMPVDQNWCNQTEKDAALLKERLDADLNTAKTSLMKEDIRTAHAAMGDLYYNRNDLSSSFKSVVFSVCIISF